ncbi:gamma-tubulin-complex subunit SPC97 NDAI_0C03410 [Naumovozyma dairenensis CBS 421]|uniref:Spindle pole body component n=1 Tax=Naumovozyma dairenensis (strain ATCC 10597 / BCRC 20456 / CBS 421 / NBRC 0211 / NRRL Y-12639) TaxID=1071378 RepID=G0W890_NAUDC|nr:hypothetical protein NDAI_0C03410 [Naumovozyma dairenensis CBS 421]CCD24001.1 hypothetical protein NDAI_0C03410 [Naumovozyma dairenensis CBS 421]
MEVVQIEDHVQLNLNDSLDTPILSKLVNYEPLSNTNLKFKSFPLSELSSTESFRDQESLVIKDLLNVLLGLDGAYIRYNNSFNPVNDHIPDFRIAKKMDSTLKALCNKVVKLGRQYFFVCRYMERLSDLSFGMVLQRLSFEIRQFIRLYYLRFVNSLEKEFIENLNFSIRDLVQKIKDSEIVKQLELFYLICLKIDNEMNLRNNIDLMEQDFNNFINDLKDETQYKSDILLATDSSILPIPRGGIILKIVQEFIEDNLGDKSSVTFLKNLLNSISVNYCDMLQQWMTQGELIDPYNEFMICDAMKNADLKTNYLKYDDRLWFTRYRIRKDGLLKKFELKDGNVLLFKVLMTGKLLNILRTSLNMSKLPIDSNNDLTDFVQLTEGTNLELYINKWYENANRLCLQLYFESYDLELFLNCLQREYFGYQNGNGISIFLQRNIIDLSRHYSKNHKGLERKLSQYFESQKQFVPSDNLVSQRMTLQLDKNSFQQVILQYVQQDNILNDKNPLQDSSDKILHAPNFENLRSILLNEASHLPKSSKESRKSNIHYLQFNLNVPYPLNIIISRICIDQYQIISRYIHLLQYHGKLLDDTWFEINKHKIWRYKGYNSNINRTIIKRCRILHNKMNNFVKVVLEYFTQNVIDKEITKIINSNKATTINDLQNVLQESLTNIMTNCCLSQLIEIQLQLFEIIHKFSKFIISMRQKLCRLNPTIYEHYLSRSYEENNNNAQDGYNEEEALLLTSNIGAYIEQVYFGFDQHVEAFIEGLTHYYNSRTEVRDSAGNDNSGRLINSLRMLKG